MSPINETKDSLDNITDFNFSHFSNAKLKICLTDFGIMIDSKLIQSENAPDPIVLTVDSFENTTDFSFSQKRNALSFILLLIHYI